MVFYHAAKVMGWPGHPCRQSIAQPDRRFGIHAIVILVEDVILYGIVRN